MSGVLSFRHDAVTNITFEESKGHYYIQVLNGQYKQQNVLLTKRQLQNPLRPKMRKNKRTQKIERRKIKCYGFS